MPGIPAGTGNAANAARPFIDFYTTNRISPVHQDVSDRRRHFERRYALYQHLGIPPMAVNGKDVLEFGPGSGHNALYTAALGPRRYVLVDANPTGLAELRENLSGNNGNGVAFEFIQSFIEDYTDAQQFDLVLCEGVIPFQKTPKDFARTVARHVRPGGLLVVTCIDGVSFLGEATRRLIADAIIDFAAPPNERLARLLPIFAPHLSTLQGMSRPASDWIYDNLLIPYSGQLFSIIDAIDALDDEFDVYGASPHFLTDWRWYKDIHGSARGTSDRARHNYLSNIATWLDYRSEAATHTSAMGQAMLDLGNAVFHHMVSSENEKSPTAVALSIENIENIIDILPAEQLVTAESLREVVNFLKNKNTESPNDQFDRFKSFFGRGQSYLSFIKKF